MTGSRRDFAAQGATGGAWHDLKQATSHAWAEIKRRRAGSGASA